MAFCTHCGTELSEAAAFCVSCGTAAAPGRGNSVAVSAPVGEGNTPAIAPPRDRTALHIFVGKNEDYFERVWETFARTGKNFSWNWAACLIGVAWFAYRKMYLHALWLAATLLILPINQFVFDVHPMIILPLTVLVKLIFGMQGNYWYQQFAQKKVSEITRSIRADQLEVGLARQGGVSVGSAIGIYVAYLIILIAVYSIGIQDQ